MVSKSKRRREAKKRASKQSQNLVSVATTSGSGRRQKNVSDFVACALNPFKGVGMSSGVPDRFDGNVVLIENECITNYLFADERDKIFLVLPTFGRNLFICEHKDADKGLELKGSVGFDSQVGPGEAYSFSAFRTISLGVQITYVGKPLDASGVIFATQFKPRLGPVEQAVLVEKKTLTEEGFESIGDDSETNIALRTFDPFSVTPSDIMASPDSSLCRLQGGAVLVAKHSSGDSWNFSDINEDDYILTDIDMLPSNNKVKISDLLGGKTFIKGFDEGSYGILFRVTGFTKQSRIIIQTRHCIEAIPSLNTGIYRTIARPSARRDPAAIDMVVDIQRNLPVAVEGGVMNWGKAVAKALSGVDVASVVRRVGAMALGPTFTAIERALF